MEEIYCASQRGWGEGVTSGRELRSLLPEWPLLHAITLTLDKPLPAPLPSIRPSYSTDLFRFCLLLPGSKRTFTVGPGAGRIFKRAQSCRGRVAALLVQLPEPHTFAGGNLAIAWTTFAPAALAGLVTDDTAG